MKPYLTTVLVCLALLATAQAQRHVDRQNRFSVEVPGGWRGAKKGLPEGTVLHLAAPDAGSVFSVLIRPRGSIETLAQLEKILIDQARKRGLTVIDNTQLNLGQAPARSLTYVAESGRVESTTALFHAGRVYFLQVASADKNRYQRDYPQLTSLVASFRPEFNRQQLNRAVQRTNYERRRYQRRERLRRERLRRQRIERQRRYYEE